MTLCSCTPLDLFEDVKGLPGSIKEFVLLMAILNVVLGQCVPFGAHHAFLPPIATDFAANDVE